LTETKDFVADLKLSKAKASRRRYSLKGDWESDVYFSYEHFVGTCKLSFIQPDVECFVVKRNLEGLSVNPYTLPQGNSTKEALSRLNPARLRVHFIACGQHARSVL
jgi:hypothetical protein